MSRCAAAAGRREWLARCAAFTAASLVLLPVSRAQPASGRATPGPPTREDRARAWFTDTVLLDQDRQRHALYSDLIAPRAVLISALFVGCSSACPLLTQQLLQTREQLGERFGRDIWFLSITVDPRSDGPDELKRFAQRHGADQPGWRFLTGPLADVEHVMQRLGLWVNEPDAHQTGLIAGNARAGRWGKLRPDGTPKALAQQLSRFLASA